ncbi:MULTISPECIES: alpha/beta hydrolase family esterase [Sphingobium]|uniref:extracellular catalytic domain type 1 short-chain-length polyhydroxyalkanoate depolymerase n=1 Tax=Sphingobium TaxID=165695 RepID=UPI00159C3801|nr:PHB depolymerase family esterase [Sphingobium sp. 15-1]
MRTLSDTISRLAALRLASSHVPDDHGRLSELTDFGSNPGDLRARTYIPEHLDDDAALVVVLHGCTQTAAGYDIGSGWSQVADRHGFALLFPEQQRQNNPNLCFNWFSPEDSRRDSGEALSIRQMIATMARRHRIDPTRIFVTGLSAGGAMTAVMLATYPELFAGGAIIAGLPYGCARTIPEAFDRMRGHGVPPEAKLAALVRGASDHAGPWPTLSIWHGSADATVNPSNAGAIAAQWRALHDVEADPGQVERRDDYVRRAWSDAEGRDVIEEYRIAGMGHGTPLDTAGEDGCGRSGAYMLETGISSTHRICAFWGLIGDAVERDRGVTTPPATRAPVPSLASAQASSPPRSHEERIHVRPTVATGVRKVIEDALRAAGLMR